MTQNARSVLQARYLKKNESGECVETPGSLFRRVARTVADVETRYGASELERQEWEQAFYELMARGDFMPNSPTLMNAGREMGMLSACFVLPVGDSINEIFDSIKHTALIQKAGGGTGFAFDQLRPTGDYIRSSGGTTSGPISFWRAFSEATNAIQQGAFRRGANMGMMYIHHPDILKFLHAKQDLKQFTNYNISVKITDAWMEDFRKDSDSPHVVRNPRNGKSCVLPRDLDIWKYDLRSLVEIDCVEPVPDGDGAAYYTTPRLTRALPQKLRGKVYTKRDIWNIIVENAWRTGEPGVVFIDRINQDNPTPQLGRIEATNPCGEQPLLPYEACNLGSINLGNFVADPCSSEATVDWEALRRVVHLSTRFLDNVIDANSYPLPEIENICRANRKIGLGIMGFADALYQLSVAYNSDQGVAWGERFMRLVNDEAHNYSEYLAKIRGCFPNWEGSVWQTRHNRKMRNAATTTVAPTGTISIIANCSGGIEPLFSLAFVRNVLRGQRRQDQPLVEVNQTFRTAAGQRNLLSDELLGRLEREGSLRHIEDVPEDIKRVFVCAHDITPDWHMRMQAAFQAHCDSSISKTINFARDAAPQDVDRIYRLAFKLRCKGVTVYRDGCRSLQPMALSSDDHQGGLAVTQTGERTEADRRERTEERTAIVEEPGQPLTVAPVPESNRGNGNGEERSHGQSARSASGPVGTIIPVPPRIEPQDLPEIVSGLRIRQLTPFGNMHVKITVDPRSDRELEVFAQLGKGGDVATSDLEAICRMTSLWLRSGGSLRHVIKQLEGIGSSLQIPTRTGRRIMSLGDGLAVTLKKYLRAKEHFGLRSLLLGEIDLAELDNPHYPPHTPERTPGDRTLQSEPPLFSATPDERRLSGGALRILEAGETQTEASDDRSDARPGVVATLSEGVCEAGSLTAPLPDTPAPADEAVSTAPAVADPPETESRTTNEVVRVAGGRAVATVNRVVTKAVSRGNGQATAALASGPMVQQHHDQAAHYKLKCPECSDGLVVQEGCCKCYSCGWAAC